MTRHFNFPQKLRQASITLVLALCFFGCKSTEKFDLIDRQAGLTRDDVTNALVKEKKTEEEKAKETAEKNTKAAPIPQFSRMLSLPKPPEVGGNKLLSFAVTEDVPLKDVLIELGRVTGIDVDVDPAISGGIIINAKNRPLEEIINRIIDRGNLRYSYKNDVLFFERDIPYAQHYTVDYLIDGELWNEVETGVNNIASSDFDSNVDASITASSVNINKSAGIITVFANSKKQRAVSQYLSEVKKNASAQVLIEAKIVEVTLSETYKTGIDWSFGSATGISTGLAASDDAVFAATITATGKALDGVTPGSVTATISALETFGSVRAIASPRINALNNQVAVLEFVDQLIYFTVEIQTDTTTDAGNTGGSVSSTTVNSTQVQEDIGTKLTITPSINTKTNEITLKVHPEISVQGGFVDDPATFINGEGKEVSSGNQVPQIQTRELETTMKIQNGGILVIGGLMKEDSNNTDTGVPFISKIPILGHLFKKIVKETIIIETVIFIKATIIPTDDEVDEYDRDIHDKFTVNPRKFF
ncbi:MAG: hypothetical protein O3B09_00955 [Proteobacteria bacterium]|nr:hypothetical protein [Pseudomonadota bacterium]